MRGGGAAGGFALWRVMRWRAAWGVGGEAVRAGVAVGFCLVVG